MNSVCVFFCVCIDGVDNPFSDMCVLNVYEIEIKTKAKKKLTLRNTARSFWCVCDRSVSHMLSSLMPAALLVPCKAQYL